jgi:hypothetical protein
MMKRKKKKTEGETERMQETNKKKVSAFAQYLKTEYRKGTISNMRAVLK